MTYEMIGKKEPKAYYDQDYYSPSKTYSRSGKDYKKFLDYLRPHRSSWLWDISCGWGVLLKAAEVYYDCETDGLDLNEFAFRETKKDIRLLTCLYLQKS